MGKKQANYVRFQKDRTPADLGRLVAENDDLLPYYYVGKEKYVSRALNLDDPASVFIGPKGVGKSAILQMVRNDRDNYGEIARLIEVAPDDLAFSALANIDSRTPLLATARQNQWLFTSLWDYILSIEILKREYPQRMVLTNLIEKLFAKREQRQVDKLLKLAFQDDGTPKQTLTHHMLSLINAIEIDAELGWAKGKARVEVDNARHAQATSDLEILSLINDVAKFLGKQVQHPYFILIDDLDLHWTGSDLQNAFLGAMFLSMRKLSRTRNVKFVVSLRDNIFASIELEDKDKFRDAVCQVGWDTSSIKEMVVQRLAFALTCPAGKVWDGLFERGAFETLFGHTTGMPRELIRLALCCVDVARRNDHRRVWGEDVVAGIRAFSVERLDDLNSLYKYRFPNLGYVTRRFRGRAKEFDVSVLEEVAFELADEVEKQPSVRHNWAGGFIERPLELARLLLEIGFLQIKDRRGQRPRTALEYDRDTVNETNWYAVHPMYAPGLGHESKP